MDQLNFIFTKNSFHIDEAKDSAWAELFKENKYTALYELGFKNNLKGLTPSAFYLYQLSQKFIEVLSRSPELEVAREETIIELSDDDLDYLMAMIPFAIGTEYINERWIKNIIKHLNEQFKKDMTSYKGTAQMYLQEKSQDLKAAKRIYFHLVENEEDSEFPFAFLATYATKDIENRIVHMPLKHALIEYKNDQKQLLDLLSCLNDVAQKIGLIAKFMETGDLFHPIRLTSQEAYTLLKSVPDIEASGIKCRVPNWWKKKYSSVKINVNIGEKKPSLLGFESILSAQPSLIVNGHALTKKEISELLKMEEGLGWLKGQWVEINHNKLQQLLEQMEKYDGTISLKDALTKTYISDEDNVDVDLGVQISNGKWLRETLGQLKDPSKIRNKAKPKYLKATLRPYQKNGYNWLNQMNDLGFGACLADDMGLGKTIQVISFLEKMYENNKESHVLLIVPASLLGNWSKEIDKFAPRMTYHILHGKTNILDEDCFATITTYGMALRNEYLQERVWDCLILDEAQAIKNPATKQTRAIKKIPSKMRIAMTGTPIENDLSNLWSLFDFLNKGLLGSATDFKNYTKKVQAHPEYITKLKMMVSPFILRRLKTDKSIISDLPDKMEITEHVDLSKRQIVLYRKEVEKAEDLILESEGMERRGIVLGLLTRLKQICNHPDQFIHDTNFNPKDSGKYAMLKKLCETIYDKRERVLVFTQYKEMCEPLSDYLESIFHKKGYIIHGGIPAKKRTEIVEKFNNEDEYVPYIVLSLKAAGTGLNLTAANHVIHFDRWWNPAVENQASDRAYRIGQTKEVFVHKLVSNGTIEEKINQIIESKQELAESILATGQEKWITEMDTKELLDLFRLDV